MRRGVFLAFVAAPAAATALLWSLMWAAREPLSVAFLVSALVYAYIICWVLVGPADALLSSLSLRAPYGNALIGALAGLVPAGVFCLVMRQPFLIVSIVVASAFGGLVFGLIARRNLTMAGDGRQRR